MNTSPIQNPTLVLALCVGIVILTAVVVTLTLRQNWKRQARMFSRMRRDGAERDKALLRMAENMGGMAQQIDTLTADMENRQEHLRHALDERVEQMRLENERRLEQIRETVGEKLDTRLGESLGVVTKQLEGVHKGLGEMRSLADGVSDLTRMLGGVKTRGVWGEAQLRTLLTEVFSQRQIIENAAIPLGSTTRVEFALRIPIQNGEALLPIDSKFPREDYLRMVSATEAGDQAEAQRSAAQLERAVLEQARQIHDKYIHPPQTTDFAIMYLPTESLYAEVARRDGLLQRMQEKYRVLAAGPATLCALLTSLQMGLRTLSLERRSGEVLELLSAMREDFARYDEGIRRMRQHLRQIESDIDTLEARARKVVHAIDSMDEDAPSRTSTQEGKQYGESPR